MQKIIKILLVFITLLLTGCGENKFDGTESSINSMMENMAPEEQVKFIKDFELASYVLRGEDKLIDYSVEDIRNEAIKIRDFAKKKNVNFLNSKIQDMNAKNKSSTYLHINHGVLSNPKVGYIYKEEFTINDLNKILNLNGDFEEFSNMNKAKSGFILSCTKDDNSRKELCNCIWNKAESKYAYSQLVSFEKQNNEEFINMLTGLAKECLNN